MLAAVLEDRFRLKSHRESRQMPVYDLSAQASGIRLPETVPGSCTPFDPNAAPPATPEEATKRAEDTCGGGVFLRLPEGGVRVTVKGFTLAQLASRLQQYVDRPVVDHTGSSKLFDIGLSFDNRALSLNAGDAHPASDEVQRTGAAKEGGANTGEASGLPNVFAALKKVGLSLTSDRGGVEVMVIDHLERPSEN